MTLGIPKESVAGETRVAMTPPALAQLKKGKIECVVESGAGVGAGFGDDAYREAGATVGSAQEVYKTDVVAKVRALGAGDSSELNHLKDGQILVATMDPLGAPEPIAMAARARISAFALELVPRITRAQAMDVLSSQANLAGYKAVLLAAAHLPKVFPMMTTAAGTITPAKVLVIGAGVAGLQAIATAKRLGAVVSGYDVRPAVKEQVESLGARFVELPLETEGAEATGGYAAAKDEAFYAKQRELMAAVIAEQDVVITTAAVPGMKAPVLVTQVMVEGMRPGSVVVDLAAERGGNCEVTQPGETIEHQGISILGPVNLPATMARDASQLFAKNVATFVLNLVDKEGALSLNLEDEIVRESMVCRDGEVVHPKVRELLKLGDEKAVKA
ncbi:MAG TPA: Re/Si-specific NAD(P)(+) transhydrogenase subunit alpha [Fimbriimonadaceae bacterium]|nr:Re/Si-specific NAD(P)(+) transhydrogenase subunit alpha [Fimbriimonadaceae bacterium]